MCNMRRSKRKRSINSRRLRVLAEEKSLKVAMTSDQGYHTFCGLGNESTMRRDNKCLDEYYASRHFERERIS